MHSRKNTENFGGVQEQDKKPDIKFLGILNCASKRFYYENEFFHASSL